MKKVLFLFLTSIITGGILVSCYKSGRCDSPEMPYQVLTISVKTWFPYTAAQDIVFENSSLQTDTIKLRNLFTGDDEIWRGDECGPGKGQFIRANFINYSSNDTIKTELGYSYIFNTSLKSIFVVYNDNQKLIGLPASYRKYEPAVTLNSKTFSECIWVECTAADNCNATGITKYYFSRTRGLVAYVKNNVLWTLK